MVKKSRNLKQNLTGCTLALALTLSVITPGFAAEEPTSPAGPSFTGTKSVVENEAVQPSSLVPIERSQNEVNGTMTIVEVFEVPSIIDPKTLVKPNFELDGYLYSMDSIVRKSFSESEKDAEMEYRTSTTTKDMAQNIKSLPYAMQYEAKGYAGELYLDPTSVTLVPTDQTTKHSTQKEVKSYPMEMNDPSQVPQLYNGLPLDHIDWNVTGYLEGSSIPSGYEAVATYSKTKSWKENSKWDVVATYRGTAVKLDEVCYTITYEGKVIPNGSAVIDGKIVEIPRGYIVLDGQLVKDPNAWSFPLVSLTIILTLLAIAAAISLFLWAIKHGLIASRKIVVEAQDDMTGEYTVIQKVRVNKKAPAFTLDTLKMPSSRHFMCEMSAKQAQVLRGKIINISADGNIVSKHQVQPTNDTDKYVFTIDLEPVEVGPVDTFSI